MGAAYKPMMPFNSKSHTQPLKPKPSQAMARKTPKVRNSLQPLVRKSFLKASPQKINIVLKLGAQPSTANGVVNHLHKTVFDSCISEAGHLKYHSGFQKFCIRCDFQRRPKVYEAL